MLRVARLTDRTGAYYVAHLEAEATPYELVGANRPETPGRWRGRGSAGLGLHGGVGPETLAAVLSGSNPANGRPLRSRATTISAFDLTFAAPKSVSMLFALGDARHAVAVLDAHVEAVEAGVAYAETHAASVRRSVADARPVLPADGLVAASFLHALSRAHDPHVHSHVVVANLAHGADGRWSAIDGRGLVAHARAAGAVYDAALRHALGRSFGLAWSRRSSGALEVDFVGTAVIGAFSGRRAEIRAYAGPRASGRAQRLAWAVTRDTKDVGSHDAGTLRLAWADRAIDAGLSPVEVSDALEETRVRRVQGAARGAVSLDERRFAAALTATFHGGVTRRQVVEAWAGALETGATGSAVERCVDEIGPWGEGVGVVERQRAPSAVVPAAHLLQALGPRPSRPDHLRTWLHAAASIERHRVRWNATEPREPLGAASDPVALARMPAAQLAAHLAVARDLEDALVRLGRASKSVPRWEIEPSRALDAGQLAQGRTGIAKSGRDWFGW